VSIASRRFRRVFFLPRDHFIGEPCLAVRADHHRLGESCRASPTVATLTARWAAGPGFDARLASCGVRFQSCHAATISGSCSLNMPDHYGSCVFYVHRLTRHHHRRAQDVWSRDFIGEGGFREPAAGRDRTDAKARTKPAQQAAFGTRSHVSCAERMPAHRKCWTCRAGMCGVDRVCAESCG
jgi:hypothetical protein